MRTVAYFITDAYTHVLALLLIGTFALNGVVVAPMLIYGSPYWPSHWLLTARAFDLMFAVLAARTVWICTDRTRLRTG